MKTWLRTVLAVVTVSLPLAGCAAQAEGGTDSQSLAPLGAAASPELAKAKGALTSVDAKFAQWLVSPSGKVTGLLLDDGSVAMVPHHAAKDVTTETLKAGDAVHVEGLSREGSHAFAFASVKKGETTIFEAPRPPADGKGKPGWDGKQGEWQKHEIDPQKAAEWRARREAKGVVDGEKQGWKHEGMRHHEDLSKLAPATATGKVVALLPGRHGETRGVVLSDGTVAYAKHSKTDAKLGDLVKKGDTITVSGKGGSYDLGKALVIETVKLSSGETKEI